jgi:4-hydroxybenzoate polyprenyltransferase
MSNRRNRIKIIRDYLILGRLFGATNTWGAIFLGAWTSTANPTLIDAAKIFVIAIFAHAYIGSINEYWHIKEDKNNPQYAYKPLVKGDISPQNARIYIYFCFTIAILFSIVFYPNLIALLALISAAAFGTFYTVKGKNIVWAYDFSSSVGAALLIIFGATAIGGITSITIIAALCAFLISVYSEWIDGMKDVDIDRKFNVPTTSVRWGYTHDKYLSLKDPNLLYFIGIVVSIDIIYSLPAIYRILSPTYFYIFLVFGIPIQCYLIYRLIGKQNKETLRFHPLLFLGSMMFLAFVLVIDKLTIWGLLITLIFIWGWVYVFSLFGVRFSHD